MPELPEVEVVRRGLANSITGRQIVRVQVLHPRPVRRHLTGPEDFELQTAGRTFAEPRRRGKYLWLPFTDGDAILAHLGMSGQFRVADADAPLVPNTRIIFAFADGEPGLRFIDQRMFGGLSLSPGGAELPPRLPTSVVTRSTPSSTWPMPSPGCADATPSSNVRSWISNSCRDRQHLCRRGIMGGSNALRPPDENHVARTGRRVITAAATVMRDALADGGTSFDALYVNINGSSGYFDRSLPSTAAKASRVHGAVHRFAGSLS